MSLSGKTFRFNNKAEQVSAFLYHVVYANKWHVFYVRLVTLDTPIFACGSVPFSLRWSILGSHTERILPLFLLPVLLLGLYRCTLCRSWCLSVVYTVSSKVFRIQSFSTLRSSLRLRGLLSAGSRTRVLRLLCVCRTCRIRSEFFGGECGIWATLLRLFSFLRVVRFRLLSFFFEIPVELVLFRQSLLAVSLTLSDVF